MRVRQLVPTRFRTVVGEEAAPESGEFVLTRVTWWMWLGRSFRVHRVRAVA